MNNKFLTASIVSTLSATVIALGLAGCKSEGQTGEPSRRDVMNARAPIASYRSRLDQIKPRIDATIDSASAMLVNADTDPKGAISAFTTNVERLRGDAQAMRDQVDELQRIGFDQYFLGSDRKTSISSDPAVTDARTRYGFVGDYMTSLRDKGTKTLAELETISAAVNANPTAEGIRSQSAAIRRLAPAKVELDSLINLLTEAIDKMPRA